MLRRNKTRPADLVELPVFRGLGRDDLTAVSDLADRVTFEPGSTVIEEGSHSHQFFVVADGTVDISHEGMSLATLETGSVLGEASLLDWWRPPRDQRSRYETGRRTADVTASGDAPVQMLVFEQRAFADLRDRAPSAAQRLVDAVSRRARDDTRPPDDRS